MLQFTANKKRIRSYGSLIPYFYSPKISLNSCSFIFSFAREMVTKYGMSDNLGPIDFQGKEQNDMFVFGENIGDKIGAEVKSLIDEAYSNAQKLLIEHRDKLDIIAQTLLAKEKINEQEFRNIFGEE